MKYIYIFLLLLTTVTEADILSVHCPLGCPTNPDNNDLIFGHVYALSNNPQTKFADWVAYEVNVLNFGESPGRNWKTEKLLDDNETLEPDDYDGAHSSNLKADRGHQAPLASFAGSRYWPELNHLSNITPQHKDLNQGAWKALEEAVRSAVSYKKSLYVITGPIYEGAPQSLPNADEPHKVPTGYYKIVYNLEGKAASFLMMQTAGRQEKFCSKQKPIIEIKSKLNFSLPSVFNSSEISQLLGC